MEKAKEAHLSVLQMRKSEPRKKARTSQGHVPIPSLRQASHPVIQLFENKHQM